MNLKTTLVLVTLVALGAFLYFFGPGLFVSLGLTPKPADEVGAQTLAILETEFKPQNLVRIEIQTHEGKKQAVVLERSLGGEWTLGGHWPTRKAEVEELVGLLTGLRSRFVPQPLTGDEDELKRYGLDNPAVTVTVRTNDKDYRLVFGEKKEEDNRNRFSWPTYLRLSEEVEGKFQSKPEVVRLAPGLLTVLGRPVDYYQQRRLFPSERVPRDEGSQEKVDKLVAKAVSVKVKEKEDTTVNYTLSRLGADWELTEPNRDQPNPDKLKSLLRALPDIWAESFKKQFDKPPTQEELAEYGLEEPAKMTVSVTKKDGQPVILVIGKESRREMSRERPPLDFPPPGQPRPLPEETIYHYALLQGHNQVFEIKFNKLKQDVLIAYTDLRDTRLARFQPKDARTVEINYGGQKLVLANENNRWRVQEPFKADAEGGKVNELLDRLSTLEARDPEAVRYKPDPKTDGLDQPPAGTIKVTVEEEVKGDDDAKIKKSKSFTFELGKQDADKHQLFVRMAGWDRINAVDDELLTLVKRPALAYRGRRIFDFGRGDLDQVEVQREGETFAVKHLDGVWRLTVPGQPEADRAKFMQLADDLSRLEAVEYVLDAKPEDHGLDKPTLSATITFKKEANKKPQKLLVGKHRSAKPLSPNKQPEYYAKLEGTDDMFVIPGAIHGTLNQGSLAYRPTQLWQVQQKDIAELRITQGGQEEYRLTPEGGAWKIDGPFKATAMTEMVLPLVAGISNLQCVRYEAHAADKLDPYGLDKPHLRLVLKPAAKKDETEVKERVLLIGKPTDKNDGRYAKLGDGEAVFVVGEPLVRAVDRGALALLNPALLTLDPKDITRVQNKSNDTMLTLERKEDEWYVVESPAPEKFPADREAVANLLDVWSNLRALRYAAYGPKVDLAKYGLDKPVWTLTVTLQEPGEEGKKTTHTLALGHEADGAGGAPERYARLDDGPGVVVLPFFVVEWLTHNHLHYVNRKVLQFDAERAAVLLRQMGANQLEIIKRDGSWHITKPGERRGDDKTMDDLLNQLKNLRAVRVVAYPAKDLKPYGLDDPAAVLTVRLTGDDGKSTDIVLKIGKEADEPKISEEGERYAQAEGSQAVVVLPAALAKRLVARPLAFVNKNLARFVDADRITLERGPRKAVFAKVDGNWKLVEPLEAGAEQTELEDFMNALTRLRADELAADRPEDLKPYGLDKPEARWHFQSGDKEVLNLIVGSREKIKRDGREVEGPRCYAKLATENVVFLLDPKLTARALAEYRNRTVWATPLDAVQIDTIRFSRAGNSFVLEKVNNAWQVAGKPEMKVNPAAVNETLAALGGLKAARYVVDKGADLKLYGLEPPELVLEVETPTGQWTLHIGRPEGESKRAYTRVPGKDRSEVFIISESDTARLVRDLPAFTK